jgi:hypothetical protein
MTYDGFLMVAMPSAVAAISRDLTQVVAAALPGEAIDNGISLDDQGGVYLVTDAYMRKLVWAGSRLSMDEADGAWKEPYPYAKDKPGLWLSRGAGATPTLMGFGPDEDHLVVLSDDRMVRASLRRRRADVRLRLPGPRGPARRAGPRSAEHPGLDGLHPRQPHHQRQLRTLPHPSTLIDPTAAHGSIEFIGSRPCLSMVPVGLRCGLFEERADARPGVGRRTGVVARAPD